MSGDVTNEEELIVEFDPASLVGCRVGPATIIAEPRFVSGKWRALARDDYDQMVLIEFTIQIKGEHTDELANGVRDLH